jgi:hypothetical protein
LPSATEAMVGSPLLQSIGALRGAPAMVVSVAASVFVAPTAIVSAFGEIRNTRGSAFKVGGGAVPLLSAPEQDATSTASIASVDLRTMAGRADI